MTKKVPDAKKNGAAIRQHREVYKKGFLELADAVGISPAMLGYIERGQRNCSLEMFERIQKEIET